MQQQKHKVGSFIAASLLLDAPDAWLTQLLSGQYLDSDNELSLFQTCKKLSEMVMQNNKGTSLRIDPLARPRNRVLNMLQTANRHAPRFNLCLHHDCDSDTRSQDRQKTETQMMQAICSILEEAALQGATKAITELQLEVAKVNTVLPPAIGKACPNLNTLSLCDCTIGLDRTFSVSKHFRNLRALELYECDCNGAAIGRQQACSMPNTDQLAALSSMTIKVHAASWFDGEIKIINSLAAPLTHLCFDTSNVCNEESVEYNLQGMNWDKLGATLQHLQLPGLRASGNAMETFLNMPCLTHVLIHDLELGKSFSGRPCKWEELVIERCVGVETLAYLPLHSGLLLKLGENASSDACGIYMDTDTCHLLPQAVSNVQRAKALEWVEGHAALSYYDMGALKLAECLAQALPLIKDVKAFTIDGGDLNGAAMQTLCEFVHGRHDELCVYFTSGTRWLLEDMVNLVAHMPFNGTLRVPFDGPGSEQQIIKLCCAAKRKLSLHAYCKVTAFTKDEEEFFEKRIKCALQARAIEVLSWNFKNRCILNVTVQPRYVS